MSSPSKSIKSNISSRIADTDINPDGKLKHPLHRQIPWMIISAARHKLHPTTDLTSTYQVPLYRFCATISNQTVESLRSIIQDRLGVDFELQNKSLVWCMAGFGQIAYMRDQEELIAALLDARGVGKNVVQLFVVDSDGESFCVFSLFLLMTCRVNETDVCGFCLDIGNLPKLDRVN
jgi:hypothetical protein